jgi:peptide deformylase
MAKILKIVTTPDPILRQRSVEVTPKELSKPEMQMLIDDMIETMWVADGVGIAAPQVGHNIRIVIITEGSKAIAVVNPTIVKKSWRKEVAEEGCLSVPGFYGEVRRSRSVHMKALDRFGKPLDMEADGLLARIIQHEIDHIDGILFIDRAAKVLPVTELEANKI